MELKIGKYTVCCDKYCWWINETKKSKKSGTEREEKVAGYSVNAEQLLDSFIENRFRDAHSKSVETYLKHVATVEREAKRIAKGILHGTQD